MQPYADLGDCQIYQGDALTVLKELPANSIHAVITSPPYWAHRQYLAPDHPDADKMIGLEPELETYIENLVRIFRECRRVLRKDGTLWLNMGESYFASGRGPTGKNGIGDQAKRLLKPKDMCGVP